MPPLSSLRPALRAAHTRGRSGPSVLPKFHVPLSAYLGAVGMPGVTAWYGLTKIIEAIGSKTLVEVMELVHAMEEKFGVSAAAPVAMAEA